MKIAPLIGLFGLGLVLIAFAIMVAGFHYALWLMWEDGDKGYFTLLGVLILALDGLLLIGIARVIEQL